MRRRSLFKQFLALFGMIPALALGRAAPVSSGVPGAASPNEALSRIGLEAVDTVDYFRVAAEFDQWPCFFVGETFDLRCEDENNRNRVTIHWYSNIRVALDVPYRLNVHLVDLLNDDVQLKIRIIKRCISPLDPPWMFFEVYRA